MQIGSDSDSDTNVNNHSSDGSDSSVVDRQRHYVNCPLPEMIKKSMQSKKPEDFPYTVEFIRYQHCPFCKKPNEIAATIIETYDISAPQQKQQEQKWEPGPHWPQAIGLHKFLTQQFKYNYLLTPAEVHKANRKWYQLFKALTFK